MPTLLLFDDDPLVRGVNAAILELEGYDVAIGAVGQDPIAQVLRLRPDAVVWSLHPRTAADDWATIAALSSQVRTARTPIVAIVFWEHPRLADMGPRNVARIILGPYEPTTLTAAVAAAIHARRTLDGDGGAPDTSPATIVPIRRDSLALAARDGC